MRGFVRIETTIEITMYDFMVLWLCQSCKTFRSKVKSNEEVIGEVRFGLACFVIDCYTQ